MWFRRKQKNRRLGREYVLDVKLRASQIRAARLRMAAVAVGVVFSTVLGIFLCWRLGDLALNRFLYENRAFSIRHIEVETDGILSAEQVRRWSRVKLEDNLLALELASVKRDLELVPLVHSASVERVLPHTLRIRVMEREPLAQITLPQPRSGGGVEFAVFHVDVEGCVMLPLPNAQRSGSISNWEQLPLLSGINPSQVQAGKRIESPQVQAALQLLVEFLESPMAGLVDIKRIDVSAPDTLLVSTGQGSEVTFGFKDLDQQLRRWRAIYERGQRMNRAIASLDLAVTGNIPARWLESSAAPPPPTKPKPLRTRKKHV